MFSLRAIWARVVAHPDERIVTLRFRTTARIARGVSSQVEKLLADDEDGVTRRCSIAFWNRSNRPPLERYVGVSSNCTIYGPLREAREGHPYHCFVPAGGLIESPGVTLPLTPDEAEDIRVCLIDAIEETILGWIASRRDAEEDSRHLPSRSQSEVPSHG